MRKVILVTFLALCAPAFGQSVGTCDTLIITGHPAYPPVAWADNGKIIGASTQLVTAIAKQLKVPNVVSKDFGSWENAQEAIKNGQADVIMGIYKNDVRQQYMNYIEPPYMVDPVSIVIRAGQTLKYKKWDDLKSLKGVTNEGESFGNKFDSYIVENLTVERSKGVDAAFDTLLNKDADYLIIGMYPGKMVARNRKIMSQLNFMPKSLEVANMYIAFSKQSACYDVLKAGFSTAIIHAASSGRVKQLLIDADKKFN